MDMYNNSSLQQNEFIRVGCTRRGVLAKSIEYRVTGLLYKRFKILLNFDNVWDPMWN